MERNGDSPSPRRERLGARGGIRRSPCRRTTLFSLPGSAAGSSIATQTEAGSAAITDAAERSLQVGRARSSNTPGNTPTTSSPCMCCKLLSRSPCNAWMAYPTHSPRMGRAGRGANLPPSIVLRPMCVARTHSLRGCADPPRGARACSPSRAVREIGGAAAVRSEHSEREVLLLDTRTLFRHSIHGSIHQRPQ